MDTATGTVGAMAMLAVVAACWRQVMAFAARVRSLVVVRVHVGGDVAQAVMLHCLTKYRRSPIGDRAYRSGTAYVRPKERVQEVIWEKAPRQALWFFDGWKPIMVGGSAFNGESQQTMADDNLLTITAIRWMWDVEALLVAAVDEHNERRGRDWGGTRYYVRRISGMGAGRGSEYNQRISAGGQAPYPQAAPQQAGPSQHERFLRWKQEEIGPPLAEKPMAGLALTGEVKDAVEEFMRWKESEKWYRARQIPWRRGWLLHGRPGTGKTSLVRAIAQTADMPVYAYDLSSLSNQEMVTAWRDMQEAAPCIALFEDIDGVFNGRENVAGEMGGGLTFDCLLNCMSGIETADGVFVMVTTNRLEMVDEALGKPGNGVSTRPGRLDRAIELPALPRECLEMIAQRILGDWPEEVAKVMQEAHGGTTGAQMTEICVKLAQKKYWEK